MNPRTTISLLSCCLLLACACKDKEASPSEPAPSPPASAPAPSAQPADTKAADTKPAEPAAAAEATDGSECEWRVEGDKLVHSSIKPRDLAGNSTEADLDGKAPTDLIVNVGECGSWGDCLFVVLQACEKDSYRVVWGPDYAQRIGAWERADGAELAKLVLHGRTAEASCDLPLETVLTWDGKEWQKGETCARGKGTWRPEVCGARPPACP